MVYIGTNPFLTFIAGDKKKLWVEFIPYIQSFTCRGEEAGGRALIMKVFLV